MDEIIKLLEAELTAAGDGWPAGWIPWPEMKPYPTEHAARLTNPGLYKRFARKNDKFDKGIHAIFGVRKDNDKVELQAIRFSKDTFSVSEAKAWLKEHDYKPILFEPATDEAAAEGPLFRSVYDFAIKAEDVREDGSFVGYGSVFGVLDSYDEIVEHGAFAASLRKHHERGSMPKMLWQHDPAQPIGVYDAIEEDQRGLMVRGRLAIDENPQKEVRQAREAYKLMQMGALDGLSIGYNVVRREVDDENRITHLLELDLWEVSLVTFPANSAARLGAVKTVRDLERLLRETGCLSRRQAAAVALHGFRGLEQGDPAPASDPQAEALEELATYIAGMTATLTRKE